MSTIGLEAAQLSEHIGHNLSLEVEGGSLELRCADCDELLGYCPSETYYVYVRGTMEGTLIVEAFSRDRAVEKVEEMLDRGDLSPDSYDEFSVTEEEVVDASTY